MKEKNKDNRDLPELRGEKLSDFNEIFYPWEGGGEFLQIIRPLCPNNEAVLDK